MIRAALAALLITIVGCTTTTVAPSPLPTPTASPTPSPTPTTTTPSPTVTRYVNPVLGYSVTLPPAWRVSACLSGLIPVGPFLGYDALTTRTPAEEHDLGAGGETGPTGALAWTIAIYVETAAQDPVSFATVRSGGAAPRVESTTLGGQPAARLVDAAGRASTYYAANAGRMYSLVLSQGFEARPPLVTDAAFEAVAQSISFVTPIARPTPTPTPTLSPGVESVVDAVAAAFAASDADRLLELMPPKCWFISAAYQSSGVSLSREKMAESLRSSFAQGRKVTVEGRPIMTDGPFLKGPFWVWSDWSAYGSAPFTPQSTTQLVFDQIDGRWYWIGALFNAGSLRR